MTAAAGGAGGGSAALGAGLLPGPSTRASSSAPTAGSPCMRPDWSRAAPRPQPGGAACASRLEPT
eukprot:11172255-Lingulodinium_polyedra.AAC.1